MSKYIVERKGIFGTLYADSPNYLKYPSTTSNKEYAYVFKSLEQAEKIAQKFRGTVIDLEEEAKEKTEQEESNNKASEFEKTGEDNAQAETEASSALMYQNYAVFDIKVSDKEKVLELDDVLEERDDRR